VAATAYDGIRKSGDICQDGCTVNDAGCPCLGCYNAVVQHDVARKLLRPKEAVAVNF